MPSFCAVANCELKYSHSENVSFHKFPLKNPHILVEWIKFTNRGSNWKPSRWNSICSRHFDKSDFREYLSRKCLKKDAIPSIVTKNNISYETYHITTGPSDDDARTLQSEHEDYGCSTVDESKTTSEVSEFCRLCGDRADNLTCNPLRSLDDPEVDLLSRKCFPTINIHNSMEHTRIVCTDCIAQLKHFSGFIDKVLSYQRELGLNEQFDSYATSENSFINGNRTQSRAKASTPNISTAMFIKQEPVNVKQEIVESSIRRPFTTQVPTTSPSLCLNPFADSKKIKGFVQQEINSPKIEGGSTYCQACDRIFGNNFEFRAHNCWSTEKNADREQGNNCEIMEIITLNNPVSFIDLADDENGQGNEHSKPKTEFFSEFERRERVAFEHAYAKRAANTNCNLKQEIIDPNNENSQDGYDYSEQTTEVEEQYFNQNPYFEEATEVYIDCLKCNQSFVSQELMDEHVTQMHSVKPKICPTCNAAFTSIKEYLSHKSKIHSQRFQCKQCSRKFRNSKVLNQHEQLCMRESKDFSFSCRHCGKSIRNLTIMKKHLGFCTGKLSETVDEPQGQPPLKNVHSSMNKESFVNETPNTKHLVKHNESHQTHNNDIDARMIPLQTTNNVDSITKQSFKVIVDDSKFIFLNENKTASENTQSVAPSATINGKFACDTCGQPFATFTQLKQHKLEHDSERKFSCSLCPKTFKGISGLKQHISGYHYKIKPYSCPVCQYSYALKGDMQRCRHSKLKNQNTLKIP